MPKRELTEPLLYLEEFLVELNSFLWLHGVKAVFLAYLDSFWLLASMLLDLLLDLLRELSLSTIGYKSPPEKHS